MPLGLILLCLALPLLELAVMIKVGQAIGVLSTLALLVGICVVGALILRAQGFAAMGRAMQAVRDGKPPVEPVVDSMFLMLAGVLFLIPGFITDVAGALLLIPPLRRGFARWVFRRMLAGGRFSASTVRVETRDGRDPRGEGQAEPHVEPRRPTPRAPGRGAPRPDTKGVVIDGEWERVEDPSKRPRGGPPRTS